MCSFEQFRTVNTAYIFHTYIRFLWFKLYQFIPSNLSAPPVPYFQKYPIFKQSHFDIFNSRYIYIHFPAKYYQISLRFVYIILTYSRILKSLYKISYNYFRSHGVFKPYAAQNIFTPFGFFLCVSYLEKSTYPTKFLFIHTLFPPW